MRNLYLKSSFLRLLRRFGHSSRKKPVCASAGLAHQKPATIHMIAMLPERWSKINFSTHKAPSEFEGARFWLYGNYARCLRVMTSKMTAAAKTAPRIMYWYEMPTPSKFMPLDSEAMTIAPMMAPVTFPTPPADETPPT